MIEEMKVPTEAMIRAANKCIAYAPDRGTFVFSSVAWQAMVIEALVNASPQ